MTVIETQCLKLLKETNRPYNVQNVADLLASQGVKKTQAEKALANLAGRGDIVCKEFGKTKIYFPSQNDYQEMGADEQTEIRKKIQKLSEDVKEQASRVRELQQELASYSARKSLDELKEAYASLQQEAEGLDQRLAVNRNGVTRISSKEVEMAEKMVHSHIQEWRRRKRSFHNVWETVSENFDGNRSEHFANIGVEIDSVNESSYEKLTSRNKINI